MNDPKSTERATGLAELEPVEQENFVEAAMKLGGKSDDEARRIGAVDRADDQVEQLYQKNYNTAASPIHRAVWDADFPIAGFSSKQRAVSARAQMVMDQSIETVKRHKAAGTLFNEANKISNQVLDDLAGVGYWGLLIPEQYGGVNLPVQAFGNFLVQMASVDGTVAGFASVHGCIGAVDPLLAYGNEWQKKTYLPMLASGERLSAFALTEPNAGSDLTALRTTAKLDGDHYVVNGEKLFISNAICGRLVGLVCLIDGKPAVLLADLPKQEDEYFQIKKYGLYALRHAYNNGLLFKDFKVPKENLLNPGRGDGLTIAYHGLNRGRVAVCANASGTMRIILAGILPWANFRVTYGQPIEKRELVRARIAKLAGLIVAADAITDWTGWLLDEGFRGEMECTIGKVFGSESLKEATVEHLMKTHGGRSFLHGHLFGEYVHEFLAPCIYEGEGEMLGMAFFKSLVKRHGTQFFEPIGKVLAKHGISAPNPLNPAHAWALRKAAGPYAKWMISQKLSGYRRAEIPALPASLAEHARFAAHSLQKSRFEIDGMMRKFALSMPDRQIAMAELSARIQSLVVILVTALWAARKNDPTVHLAADVACSELKRKVTGARITSPEMRAIAKLGKLVAEGEFKAIAGVDADEILMKY